MTASVIDFPRFQAERLRSLGNGLGWRALVVLVVGGLTAGCTVAYLMNAAAPLRRIEEAGVSGAVLGFVIWWIACAVSRGDRDERARIQAGLEAEDRVVRTLARQLPDGYVLINSLALPGSGDVDHIVIGQSGIFVLETKAYTGDMVCEDGTWSRTRYGRRGGCYDAFIGDPTRQVEQLVARINGLLRAGGCGDRCATGFIVFASDKAIFDDSGSRVPAFSVRELAEAVRIYPTGARLSDSDVERVMDAILTGVERAGRRPARRRGRRPARVGQAGQAAVEAAVALPLVLLLTMGVLGGYRIAAAAMGVGAVAREAARAAAVAPDAATASSRGMAHGLDTAVGLGLRGVQLTVDARKFGPGGTVWASAAYTVELGDLPLVGWVRMPVQRQHAAPVDVYRQFAPGGGGG